MKTLKRSLYVFLAIAGIAFGCKKDDPAPITTGQVMFWTDASGASVDVTVNGLTKTITEYYSSGSPSKCGESGNATYQLNVGSYSYTAKDSDGYTWSGDFTITADGCLKYLLTI